MKLTIAPARTNHAMKAIKIVHEVVCAERDALRAELHHIAQENARLRVEVAKRA